MVVSIKENNIPKECLKDINYKQVSKYSNAPKSILAQMTKTLQKASDSFPMSSARSKINSFKNN